MENVSRIDDLLILNLFQCRDDFSLEVLAGLLPQLIIYLLIILFLSGLLQELPLAFIYTFTWTHGECSNIRSESCRAHSQGVSCCPALGNHREFKAPWSRLVPGTSCVRWKEGIICPEKSWLKMHMHSLKPEWSILLYVRDWGCVLCFWSPAPLPIGKEGYFTWTGLREIVLLECQPHPHYQMSNSLLTNSPFHSPPLKEVIGGCWEGQKGSCWSWFEGEEQFLLVSFQS